MSKYRQAIEELHASEALKSRMVTAAKQDSIPKKKRLYFRKRLYLTVSPLLVMLLIGTAVVCAWGERSEAKTFSLPNDAGDAAAADYCTPLLPLRIEGDLEGVTAAREVRWELLSEDSEKAGITETYLLKNLLKEKKQLTVYYPLAASFCELEKPVLKLNSDTLETNMFCSEFCGKWSEDGLGNLRAPAQAEEYRKILEDSAFWEEARAEGGSLDEQVTVYALENLQVKSDKSSRLDGTAPYLTMEFSFDPDQTGILTYGFNGYDMLENTNIYGVFAEHAPEHIYLIARGAPLQAWQLRGYTNGSCEIPTEDVTGTIRVFESTLGEVLADCAAEQPVEETVLLTAAASRLLAKVLQAEQGAYPRYEGWLRLDDIIADTAAMERIFWFETEITIPAEGCVQVHVSHTQKPSFSREVPGRIWFELVAQAGSALRFDEIKIEVQTDGKRFPESSDVEFSVDGNMYSAVLHPEQECFRFDVSESSEFVRNGA